MGEILLGEIAPIAIVASLAFQNQCVFDCRGFAGAKVLAKLHYCTVVERRQPGSRTPAGQVETAS